MREDGSDEDPMPDDTEDDEAVVVRRRPVRPLPRENWSDQAAKTSDQEDDDAGSGGAKNRGIPSTPKIDVPESKLPDIGEINARNQAFWAGALTNKNPGPNSAGSLDVEKRLSNTMKQLAPGRTFGITSDQVAQGKAYRAQTARQAKLVAAIEAKNAAFYTPWRPLMSEAEALSSTRIDMLRNNITAPQTTPVAIGCPPRQD